MGDFKEWLSDNLRYFLVGVVVILIIGGSILGLKIYSSAVNGKDEPALIQKNTQAQTESKKETETKKETEKATKKQTEKAAEKTTESQAASSDQTPDGNASDDSSSHGDGSEQNGDTYGSSNYNYDDSQQAEVISQETEAPQPQYMTINAACYMRSYPDYGDNIIGQFDAGTTVQFLADEGGWYKVSVNGQTGYIGARFFN